MEAYADRKRTLEFARDRRQTKNLLIGSRGYQWFYFAYCNEGAAFRNGYIFVTPTTVRWSLIVRKISPN